MQHALDRRSVHQHAHELMCRCLRRRPLARDRPQGLARRPARSAGDPAPPQPSPLPRRAPHLRRQPQCIVIDLTLVLCHGQPLLDISEAYRSTAKDGTSHFHASAYASYWGQRWILALTVVQRGEKMEAVLKRLLARLGLPVRFLLLDRGFRAWR